MSEAVFLFDAGPLIHISELGCQEILDIFPKKLTTRTVLDEISSHLDVKQKNYIKSKLVIKDDNKDLSFNMKTLCKLFSLDKGEQSVFNAIEKMLDDDYARDQIVFASDDAAARLAANNLNILSVGTIGLIIKSVTLKKLEKLKALEIIISIPDKSTLHLKPSFHEEIILKLKNKWKL